MKSLLRNSRMSRLTLAGKELRQVRTFGWKAAAALVLLVLLLMVSVYAAWKFPGNEKVYMVDAGELAPILASSPRIELGSNNPDVSINRTEAWVASGMKGYAAYKNVLDTLDYHNSLIVDRAYRQGRINYSVVFPIWVKLLDIEEASNMSSAASNDEQAVNIQQGAYRGAGDVRGAIESALTETKFNEIITPSDLDRILPVKSIVLMLLLLTPLVFISTMYNNSVFEEKIEKKATLLFVSGLRPWQITINKTLPYMAGAFAITVAMLAYFNYATLIWMLAPLAAIVMLYFSLNFLLSVVSRSYKEISFLKTSMGSVFIAYILLPTLFTQMSDIAYISPLTSIVQLVEGNMVPFKLYFFSFAPMLLASIAIYYFAQLLVNEELLYSHKGITAKILDMVSGFLTKPYRVGLFTIFTFPIILTIELVFLLLVALPSKDVGLLFLVLIAVAAIVEELFKNVSIYLVYSRGLFDAPVWKLALYSGSAFALAEKGLLLVMIPVLLQAYAKIVIPVLIVPFVFHSLTCAAFALLARRTSHPAIFIVPIAIHILYGVAVYGVFA